MRLFRKRRNTELEQTLDLLADWLRQSEAGNLASANMWHGNPHMVRFHQGGATAAYALGKRLEALRGRRI